MTVSGPDQFDRKRLLEHLNADTAFELVLRGHLWIESLLIKMIEEFFPHPDRIDLARLNFPSKVSLASALGLLEPEETPVLLRVNRLRNRLAHDLDMLPTALDEEELVSALSPTQFQHSGLSGKEYGFPDRMRRVFASICMMLHTRQKQLIELREYQLDLHRQVEELLGPENDESEMR